MWGGGFFFEEICLKGMVVLYPKKVINLPRICENLYCKGEPYRFSGYEDPSLQKESYTKKDPVTFIKVTLKSNL